MNTTTLFPLLLGAIIPPEPARLDTQMAAIDDILPYHVTLSEPHWLPPVTVADYETYLDVAHRQFEGRPINELRVVYVDGLHQCGSLHGDFGGCGSLTLLVDFQYASEYGALITSHEIGHGLGLRHLFEPGNLMNTNYSGTDLTQQQIADMSGSRYLDGDDLDVLIYFAIDPMRMWETTAWHSSIYGDFTGDGVVDGSDFNLLMSGWRPTMAETPEAIPLSLLFVAWAVSLRHLCRDCRIRRA